MGEWSKPTSPITGSPTSVVKKNGTILNTCTTIMTVVAAITLADVFSGSYTFEHSRNTTLNRSFLFGVNFCFSNVFGHRFRFRVTCFR